MLLLFDLDDTLLDHTRAFFAGTVALHERLSVSTSFEDFSVAWERALARNYDRYLAGELTYDGQRLARVREVVDSRLSDDDAARIFAVYLEGYERAWSVFPDVEPALARLAGHTLGIVTNGQGHQQRLKLERTGLLTRFDCIVISEDVGVAKPRPEIFLEACSRARHEPSNSVFIGDRYDIDALGARGAGLRGIWLDRAGTATTDHQPPIIKSLLELPDLTSD